jgi:quercetin dioxygenase-like cupin family protein
VRTVIAATKLPTVTDAPLYFDVANVTLAPGQTSGVSKANGVIYQLTGSTEVSLAGKTKTINAGEGLFVGAGKTAQLKGGGATPSTRRRKAGRNRSGRRDAGLPYGRTDSGSQAWRI